MKTDRLHNAYEFGIYRNRLACTYTLKGKYTIIVFKDISAKRCSRKNKFQPCRRASIFISNKNLMDFTHPLADYCFMQEARKLVFDAKLGTRYEYKYKSGGGCGGYFDGLHAHMIEIRPYKR